MGREVRKVPKDWEHPKTSTGEYIPMLPSGYDANEHEDVMPTWNESEATHWMMYEDCSEGTPISPAFESPEELARWLTDTGASSFASMTATYTQWITMIQRGWAPSAIMVDGVLKSGVAGSGH